MDKRRWLVPVTFLLGLASALLLVAVGYVVSAESVAIGPELMKAGVQVGAVTLIGSGIALMLRVDEERRANERREEARKHAEARELEATTLAEERRKEAADLAHERRKEAANLADERRKAEYRSHVFRDLVIAYNGLKSARRILRAGGYRRTASNRVMSAGDVAEFNLRMRSLTESQLLFERVLREVRAREEWFATPGLLIDLLDGVEKYVNAVVRDWENTNGEVVAGAHLSLIHSLTNLQNFLAAGKEGFRAGAADPMLELEVVLREAAYPESAAAPSRTTEGSAASFA
jgi:hypothetical protein